MDKPAHHSTSVKPTYDREWIEGRVDLNGKFEPKTKNTDNNVEKVYLKYMGDVT